MEIIYCAKGSKRRKRGWTYILLSADRRRMKIGRAIPDLERRIYQHMTNQYYKDHGFKFLLAIDDAKYESILHSLFDEYRARYKWKGKIQFGEHFTKKEAMKKSRSLYELQVEKTIRINEFFWENIQITTHEEFHIPPRKIGSNIKNIVLGHI